MGAVRSDCRAVMIWERASTSWARAIGCHFTFTMAPRSCWWCCEDVQRFEEHIGDCFWCERYLEQMRTTIDAVGRIDEASLSPEARDSLLDAFRDWRRDRQPPVHEPR